MADIKISELSIGDWAKVEVGLPSIIGKAYKISAIATNGFVNADRGSGSLYKYDINKLSPIPLTPEILEKNGFRKNGEYNEWNIGEWDEHPFIGVSLDRQCIRIKHFGNDIYIEGKVVYVHQLQNALRLAGVGKEIEL